MYKGDIANDVTRSRVAVMFEGLLMHKREEPETKKKKRRWWPFGDDEPEYDDTWIEREVRRWAPNDLPIKSVQRMQNNYNWGVDVYTYYDPIFKPHIEHWLSRKGIHSNVFCYDDVTHLAEDLRYDRSVHTLFTSYERDAHVIGWHRATVVNPDGQIGT